MAKLFSPKMPEVKPPASMPDPQSPAVLDAERRRRAAMMARGGRDSTILSENLMGSTGKLGG